MNFSMPKYRIHRVNFYNFSTNAIHCLCYDESSSRLALSRADFSIEIWDIKNASFQERVIYPVNGTSVEALAWCKGRLFSTGLTAFVTEYDLCTLNDKQTAAVIGGPAWCLAANKEQTLLAAGTEDGYICIFHVISDSFSFERRFDKQEGRVLCLSWHESGNTLVTGSVDSIRIWDVLTGHAVNRITVGRIKKSTETIVWCLSILKDHTIVSGDSCGRTSFWNGKTGTLLSSSKVHKADVLSLAVSKDEDFVYTSGIDPIIFQFAKVRTQSSVKNDSREIWVKSVQRVLHTHDVRALAMAGQLLVSGGVDSHLVMSKYPPKMCLKYPPVKQGHCVKLATVSRCLLLQYTKLLEVWKLGNTSQTEGNDGDLQRLSQKETKALLLNCQEGEQIICSDISDDSKWIAYSTSDRVRLYNFTLEDDPLTLVPTANLQKIRWLPVECHSAQILCFTLSGKYLLIATSRGKLQILETNLIQPCLVHTFSGPSDNKDRISLLACSRVDQKCAAADSLGNIVIYDLNKMEIHSTLPHYKGQPTALAFSPYSNNVVVSYTDHKIVEYDCLNKCYTKWSKTLNVESLPLNPYYPILKITFAGTGDLERVILHDDNTVYFLDKETESVQSLQSMKRSRHEENINSVSSANNAVKTSKKFKHLLSISHLNGNELVAVELLPNSILEKLPPAIRRKKFGT